MMGIQNGRAILRGRALASLSSIALGVALAPAAAAQTTDLPPAAESPPTAGSAVASTPPETTPDGGLQDIIVTAQRRAQNVQDVPISITAFSGESLEKRDIVNIQQLSGFAPNVQIVSRRNASAQISMRGTGTTNPSIVFDPAVGLYIDGIYIGKSQGSVFDVADIANLEVLRGPQGTLFGRNTLAGAVNIVTEKPTGEWGGRLKIGYGNYDDRLARGSINLPALGTIFVKLSGFYEKRDGFIDVIDNPFPNVSQALPKSTNHLESRFNYGARAAVRWRPTPNLTVDYTFDYSRTNNRTTENQLVFYTPGGIFDPKSPVRNVAGFGPAFLYVRPNERQSDGYANGGIQNEPLFERSRVWAHSLTAELDLGGAAIKSISSYRHMKFHQSFDLDGTPLPLIESDLRNNYKAYSQEFQLTGKAGRLNYTAGLYYFRDSAPTHNEQSFFGNSRVACTNCVIAASYPVLDYAFTTNAYAAYGQLEWNPPILDDKLILTAGGRYTIEKRSSQVSRLNYAKAFMGGTVPLATSFVDADAHKTFRDFTPTLNARYEITSDVSVYARYAKGFKSGGFNGEGATPYAATLPYKPETIDSYEIGLKAFLFDRKLRFNLALFNDEHKDQQNNIFTPGGVNGAGVPTLASVVANAASARIRGIELDVEARPAEWLTLSGTLGTLSSKYKKFIDNIAVPSGPNSVIITPIDVSKDRSFPYAPKLTASASMDARLFKADFGQLNLVVDYKHSDRFYSGVGSLTPTTRPNALTTEADPQNLVDARLVLSAIQMGGGELEATIWVRNIFDQSDRLVGTDYGPSFGGLVVAGYNDPRTYGATLGFRF